MPSKEMIDLGYMDDMMSCAPSDKKKKKKLYPCVHMYEAAPDALMEYKVGDELRIEAVIKIKGKELNDREGTVRKGMDFDILKMQVLSKAGKISEEEFDKMSDKEKESYKEESVGLK